MSQGRLTFGTLLLVAFSVSMSVTAQLCLRHGMAQVAAAGKPALLGAAGSPWVYAGLAAYGLGTVTWLQLLARIDLVVAYPLGALNFVFITALSGLLLQEVIPPGRWLGIAFILVGIFVVARGERGPST